MNSHWPILLAILMVGAAGVYGFYVQGENEQRGKVVSEIKQLPSKYVSTPLTAPASPASKFNPAAQAVNVVAEKPNAVAQPMRVPTPGAAAPAVGVDREVIFNNLRVALSQRFGVLPTQTKVGFSYVIEGARIDVDGIAWSISLYNINKAQPAVQSEGFMAILNLVAASLDFDVNVPANTTADGKLTRRPISKLGKLSMVTDPAMNNSIVIKPIVRKPVPAVPNANVPNRPVNPAARVQPATPAKPAQPAKPLPLPVQPAKPPTTDQF